MRARMRHDARSSTPLSDSCDCARVASQNLCFIHTKICLQSDTTGDSKYVKTNCDKPELTYTTFAANTSMDGNISGHNAVRFRSKLEEKKGTDEVVKESQGTLDCRKPENTNGSNDIACCFDENEAKQKIDDLLHWQDMPKHLQFNPYIFTGYRPLLTFWGCISSLFYIHNETINIFTHAIPIVYILFTIPGYMPWSDPQFRFLSWCHLVGSVAPWIGSFVYHLFMNLQRGESVYYRLLQLDMLGIWISQSFGAMPMVTASVHCLPFLLRWTCILSYCVLSLWGLYKAMTAWSPWERRLCFLLPFSMRMLLCGLRVSSFGGGDPASLTHVILQDAVSVVGAAIGAMHIPEKWFPGTVDLYLNSHNIMHVLVVAAVYSMHQATVRDLAWMARVQCHGPPLSGGASVPAFVNHTVTGL